ncbi:hypothetical protein GCM10007276_21140 [Agaricicola taiwanensis]|uniref:Thioredoxin n=1 Tax=Agaricicola taiwanensis TaxID=591372 RepID=A0A8J3DUY8_9RHOB|nr:hypothetical protein [Agaricicola taiwanensis]GGE43793.1 hypothetical protein GCM10007276_21140 [Agaricicola taiwanensis]
MTFALVAGLTVLFPPASREAQAAQLVLFEGSWCPTCRYWNKTVAPNYATNDVGRLAPLRRVEIGTPRPAGLDKPNVGTIFAVPTFVVMEKGREVGRIEGFTTEKHFWRRLGNILSSQKLAGRK